MIAPIAIAQFPRPTVSKGKGIADVPARRASADNCRYPLSTATISVDNAVTLTGPGSVAVVYRRYVAWVVPRSPSAAGGLHARVAVRPQAGQPSVSRAPKVCLPISSARAWPTTVPVAASGCSRAQVGGGCAGEEVEGVAAENRGGRAQEQLQQQANHRAAGLPDGGALRRQAVTVTGSPVSGSAEVMTTSRPSMAGMPSASIAHIDHAAAPPAIWTRCGVWVAENG